MRLAAVSLVLATCMFAGCGGEVEEDDDELVISESDSALATAEPAADEDDADRGDDGCKDEDHDGHRRHRHHWFRVLDRLDGQKDKVISIALLPPGLPDRLIAKLHRIDRNDDGVVAKKEVKRWRKHRHDRDRPSEAAEGE